MNPVDVTARQSGVFVGEPPFVLGWDVSGTVETVCLRVTIYQPGDEVFGMLPFPQGHSGYAQYVIAPARAFVLKPEGLELMGSLAVDYGCLVSQWDAEAVKALRSAVYNGDGSVVGVVCGRLTGDVLQLAGGGLLDAVTQDVEGAVELAAQCAAALRDRCWDGDEDLADQLQAALGQGPTPLLRSLPVDLDELASLLEGDPLCGGGRIDLRSGECWPQSMECDADDGDEDDEDRWLHVAHEGSREGYRDMELFIATMEDPAIIDRLQIAITGTGAFRRFKDVLSRWPQELQRYYQLSNERQRGRARAWLAAEGFRPAGAAKPRS